MSDQQLIPVQTWYALYTRARNEKKVAALLERRGIEIYLPLQRRLKQWSDRKKWVDEVFIKSYLFVRISEKDYINVLEIPGSVRFITFNGKAAPIPDRQIQSLKILLANSADELEIINENLQPGDPVEIITGPLAGMHGEVVNLKGSNRVILRLDHLGLSIVVDVSLQVTRRF